MLLMKFLVIMRPNGQPYGIAEGERAKHAGELRQALTSGEVEAAYAFVAGGGAYVVNADDTGELLSKVRDNPYFRSSHVDVIPVLDADLLMEGVATGQDA
jgi:hypothetical protein